ncbi:hypothetical protein [uncultured Psychroserpens sp.]|uniref:hypothetical protein n=1 Tax=uncultured Psychroserpens sp. TaxID=255436 RepID=UPI002603668E|nr:hypothetical protein [uncultured Psychroserpens sp.]
MASIFASTTGIDIPKEIVDFYELHEDKNIDFEFIRLFRDLYGSSKKGEYPYISLLISENFALEILKLIYAIPDTNRMEILFESIKNHPFNGIHTKIYLKNNTLYRSIDDKPIAEDTEEFIIEEILFAVNDYDYRSNSFNFPLIQKAYESLNSDSSNIKVILILSVDCGGEGGIIVRGKHMGYSASYAHIDESYVMFNEKRIAYSGFLCEDSERPYIEMDKKKLN